MVETRSGAALRIAFRVDSSSIIGAGHVSRCLNMVEQLASHSVEVLFIGRNLEGNSYQKVLSAGIPFRLLGDSSTHEHTPDGGEGHWLSVSADQDLHETGTAIIEHFACPVDWLIVDHYGIDSNWLSKARAFAKRVFVIDDLANRTLDCDVLLNAACVSSMKPRYAQLLPSHCQTLLGPSYVMLRKEFFEARFAPKKRVVIYFGGGRNREVIRLVGQALAMSSLPGSGYKIECVRGPGDATDTHLEDILNELGIGVLDNIQSMSDYMSQTALCFGAGGISLWERLLLGVPTVAIAIAANQEAILSSLFQDGLLRYLGRAADVTSGQIVAAIDDFCSGRLRFKQFETPIYQDFLWPILSHAAPDRLEKEG